MNIAVLFNSAKEGGFKGDGVAYAEDAIYNAHKVFNTLKQGGHKSKLIEITRRNYIEEINRAAGFADAIFNLTESVGLKLVLEVINELERIDAPLCGAGYKGHLLTSDKTKVKTRLLELGVPVPKWQVFETGVEEVKLDKYPLIVKSATEHGSVSVRQNSVVTNKTELSERVGFLLNKFKDIPVIAEKYIDGRELNATVVGSFDWARCLNLSEVLFKGIFDSEELWPICTYEGNYDVNAQVYKDSPSKIVTNLGNLENQIKELAVKAAVGTDCFDYCRIDIRLEKGTNIPYFVDINSYPCLIDRPDDTITISRKSEGLSFIKFLEEIAVSGIRRKEKRLDSRE